MIEQYLYWPSVQTEKPGETLTALLDECKPGFIVETGCMRDERPESEWTDGWSTVYLAQWVKDHGGQMFSMDLDESVIEKAKRVLVEKGLFSYDTNLYWCNSLHGIEALNCPVDFAYLDSCDDLANGLEEFQAVEAKGAKMVVMDDFPTKARLAAIYAQKRGYQVEQIHRFTVIRLTA